MAAVAERNYPPEIVLHALWWIMIGLGGLWLAFVLVFGIVRLVTRRWG